jgi:hypothetical protein
MDWTDGNNWQDWTYGRYVGSNGTDWFDWAYRRYRSYWGDV